MLAKRRATQGTSRSRTISPETPAVVADQPMISSQLFAWKRRMLEGGCEAVQADEDVVGTSKLRELEKRVRELEGLLGRKTVQVEILKEALDFARVKTDLAAGALERSGVTDTVGAARSNLVESLGGYSDASALHQAGGHGPPATRAQAGR